jgi:SAM-dependent methyltransferase
MRYFRTMLLTALVISATFAASSFAQKDTTGDTLTALQVLNLQADTLSGFVSSPIAKQFLAAVPDLPSMQPRTIYVNKTTRTYLSEADYIKYAKESDATKATDSSNVIARSEATKQSIPSDSTNVIASEATKQSISSDSTNVIASEAKQSIPDITGFEKRELGEEFYYFTRYGTPLAFVRALDLVGTAGLAKLDGARIADYGFGSVGHLRLLASCGANVTGIEVDPLLKLLYAQPSDAGFIARARSAGEGKPGQVTLAFGSFPADSATRGIVGQGYDLFISKNTLKHGYIHPEREVDPRMLVQLGISDSAYIKTVYDLLKPGGLFMIYNLHPKLSAPDEKYLPWSDGRCPFAKELLEAAGFTVLGYNVDDTEQARAMGTRIGWDKEMNYETDLYGQYTLVRK